jgi:phosphomannomutase
MLKEPPRLPDIDGAAEAAYIRRYVQSFSAGALSGVRVLVYQHSAVGRDLLPRILRELGAEVITAGRSESFVPIDTENITDQQLDSLEQFALTAQRAGTPLDAVVSTDGDSDRPLVTAVVAAPEIGRSGRRLRFLPGDLLGLLVAEYLRADAAAVSVSANDAVERRMAERGISLKKTRIGSPYVISAMEEFRRGARHERIVGWESNGGFLTGSDISLPAGPLPALPTRDSTLPVVAPLIAAAEQRVSLATLYSRLPAGFGRAGLLDNVPVEVSRAILSRLAPPSDRVEVEFEGMGDVFDRSVPGSTNAAPLGFRAAEEWQRCKATLARFFTPALGFDEIVRINVLDGVRVYFRGGDVAHVRPSGNAPQLRIYATSDSQARADQIVELALREPDGILRRLERAFS